MGSGELGKRNTVGGWAYHREHRRKEVSHRTSPGVGSKGGKADPGHLSTAAAPAETRRRCAQIDR